MTMMTGHLANSVEPTLARQLVRKWVVSPFVGVFVYCQLWFSGVFHVVGIVAKTLNSFALSAIRSKAPSQPTVVDSLTDSIFITFKKQ
jgi:hypothetical protein